MIDLIKKYSLLLIIGIVLSNVLSAIFLVAFPDLLISELPNGGTSTLSVVYLTNGLEYLVNIFILIILAKDMKTEKVNSPIILIMTFFSAFIGIVIFLLSIASNKINPIKIELNE